MKNLQLLLFFLLLTFFSCSSKHQKPAEASTVATEQPVAKQELKAGEIISAVICENDASQSYALYLPKKYSGDVKFPVIIFFDSHGSGSYPVGLYRSLAERFGYILMGSNNSKNGMQFDQTNSIAANLIHEASSRFSGDAKRISFCGFSGGSKVALVAASAHPELLSVIYCGASVSMESLQQLPPALGFAGVRDMNYTEVVSSGPPLDAKKINHFIVEWKGKHEWPDSVSMQDAFYWSSFTAMRNKTAPVDKELVQSFLKEKNKNIAAEKNVLLQHDLYNRIVVFLHGLTDVSHEKQKLAAITQSGSYQKEVQQKQSVLQTEGNLKKNYLQCFESKDLTWWKDEIARMRALKAGEQEMMYQRLLGYLSLASYSYSNNAIKQNNFSSAQQFLSIYKLADPENPEQPFLMACMYARQGDQGKAIAALQEAVQLGLKDRSKIEKEESFNNLRSNPEFNKLLSGI